MPEPSLKTERVLRQAAVCRWGIGRAFQADIGFLFSVDRSGGRAVADSARTEATVATKSPQKGNRKDERSLVGQPARGQGPRRLPSGGGPSHPRCRTASCPWMSKKPWRITFKAIRQVETAAGAQQAAQQGYPGRRRAPGVAQERPGRRRVPPGGPRRRPKLR